MWFPEQGHRAESLDKGLPEGPKAGRQQWGHVETYSGDHHSPPASDWFTLYEKLSNLTMFQLKCLQF